MLGTEVLVFFEGLDSESVNPEKSGNVCLYVSFFKVTSSCFSVSGSMLEIYFP